jgi:hypothetical protein
MVIYPIRETASLVVCPEKIGDSYKMKKILYVLGAAIFIPVWMYSFMLLIKLIVGF